LLNVDYLFRGMVAPGAPRRNRLCQRREFIPPDGGNRRGLLGSLGVPMAILIFLTYAGLNGFISTAATFDDFAEQVQTTSAKKPSPEDEISWKYREVFRLSTRG
jgi:hypothetical protein|tara:strand:- start:65 stop:376 length:312 start_codon:yes stop_codon:yes gene_type:complete